MAELATGAVSTLLGVISNEAKRLGRVRGDVQFIQEEMESMSSFLAHLTGTTHQHNEQVRNWMNQVRIFANDCNSCIFLYLYRGDAKFHRSGWGLRRCLLWAPWQLRKMIAQHRAAGQLSELKARARDIAERRMRYGVEVKLEPASSSGAVARADEEEDEEEDEEDYHHYHDLDKTTMNMDKEAYVKWKLESWIRPVVQSSGSKPSPSIAFLVPKTEDAGDVTSQALDVVKAHLKGAEHEEEIKWDVVLVDIPEFHDHHLPLQPEDILYYILHELQHPKSHQSHHPNQHGTSPPTPTSPSTKLDIYRSKVATIEEIMRRIKVTMKVPMSIHDITRNICNMEEIEDPELYERNNDLKRKKGKKHLAQLLLQLIKSTAAATAEQDQENRDMNTFAAEYDGIIQETAKKLKGEIEAYVGGSEQLVPEYEDILREVFPRPTITTIATNSPTSNTLVEDQIQEIIQGLKEMLHELRELDKYSDKYQETARTLEVDFKETTTKKMEEILVKITDQLLIKGIVHKIQNCLGGGDKSRILVILKTHDKYLSKWEETRNTLSRLGCAAVVGAMIVASKTTQRYKKDFCYPQEEPELVEYPLIGRFLDTVLQCTGQHIHEDIHNIFYECEPHEPSMKIFAHALFAKPKRRSEDLRKLHTNLQATPKSLHNIARKVFKFSYDNLPKEYKSCLLYLAIFPQGYMIRRSTLIGRWVAEGLITTKDSCWSSSVDEAEKCFYTLIARCLVSPAGTSSTGSVKGCTVDKLLYGFIVQIAIKRGILETGLPRHLACHFSIFSGIRLRMTDEIENFLEKTLESSQFSRLTVLDLEGYQFKYLRKYYLRVMCSKMLMLKYLSLKGTDVTRLPSAINNLFELEVLDIRETKIAASATRNILLQKLKRLLAGHVDSSPGSLSDFSSVHIPEKIEEMEGVEILSNVRPKNFRDLKNLIYLNSLKKLGVVINKESDLKPLLYATHDLLNQSLRVLSITVDISIYESPLPEQRLDLPPCLERLTINGSKNFPKDLENLTSSTHMGKLLEYLTQNGKQLTKVTISCTFFSQEHLKVLAKLENLRCVKLGHNAYTESKLTFKKGEFKNLNGFLVEGTNMNEILFDSGAVSKLEKIILSSTNIVSISGVDCLQKLEELELNNINNKGMLHSLLDDAKHIAKVILRDTLLEQGDLDILAHKPKMRYLAVFGKFYNGKHLSFNKDEFQKLSVLIVDSSDSDITELSFNDMFPNLEKILWRFKKIDSLSGIDKLPALKEIELNGHSVPNEVEEDIKRLKSELDYKHIQT